MTVRVADVPERGDGGRSAGGEKGIADLAAVAGGEHDEPRPRQLQRADLPGVQLSVAAEEQRGVIAVVRIALRVASEMDHRRRRCFRHELLARGSVAAEDRCAAERAADQIAFTAGCEETRSIAGI